LTDVELIQNSLSGNDAAFREIIDRYEAKVAATVISMLGNCPEADDVGQETFIRFYKNLKNFRGESSLGTYLTRIAMNLSLNELKRRKRQNRIIPLDDPGISHQIIDHDSGNEKRDRHEIVQWAIAQLTPKFQSTLVLRMMKGYSTEETAKILNLPTGTVLSRLARARGQLLKILEPYKEYI